MEKYMAFRKNIKFITFYSIDQEKITMQICKNVVFQQSYSTELHDYIKKTSLQISPNVENPLRLFSKLYNWIKIQNPMEKE